MVKSLWYCYWMTADQLTQSCRICPTLLEICEIVETRLELVKEHTNVCSPLLFFSDHDYYALLVSLLSSFLAIIVTISGTLTLHTGTFLSANEKE